MKTRDNHRGAIYISFSDVLLGNCVQMVFGNNFRETLDSARSGRLQPLIYPSIKVVGEGVGEIEEVE